MKTFKLVLLIVVLLTTTWLMAEGVKVNNLAQPTTVSQSGITSKIPPASTISYR